MKARHEKDMATSEFRIPVLSLLKDGKGLFLNLQQYFAAMESLYYRSQDTSIIESVEIFTREVEFIGDMDVEDRENVATTLRLMAMSKQWETEAEMSKYPLFPPELLPVMKWRKRELKQSMHQYRTRLRKLKECQAKCFKSDELEERYRYYLDLLETSLEQNMIREDEYELTLTLIDRLKKDLTKEVGIHDSNMREFNRACKREVIHREEIARSASKLEIELCEAITLKLQSILGPESREDLDYEYTSQVIYELITRAYILDVSPFVQDQNRTIQQPDKQKPLYNPKTAKRIIKAAGRVIKEKLEEHEPDVIDHVEVIPGIPDDTDRETDEQNVIETMTQTKVKPKKKKGLFASLKRKIGKKK